MIRSVLAIGMAVLAGCSPDVASKARPDTMSLVQAEAYCETQSNMFARRPLPIPGEGGARVGLLAEYPDDFQVQQFYRGCVKARSGISTKKRVAWRL